MVRIITAPVCIQCHETLLLPTRQRTENSIQLNFYSNGRPQSLKAGIDPARHAEIVKSTGLHIPKCDWQLTNMI